MGAARARSTPPCSSVATRSVVALSLSARSASRSRRADRVSAVNHIPEQMVIPPRFILLDVQRAFFPWSDEAISDGDGEVVTVGAESASPNVCRRPTRRALLRADVGEPAGVVHIDYEWSDAAGPCRSGGPQPLVRHG